MVFRLRKAFNARFTCSLDVEITLINVNRVSLLPFGLWHRWLLILPCLSKALTMLLDIDQLKMIIRSSTFSIDECCVCPIATELISILFQRPFLKVDARHVY